MKRLLLSAAIATVVGFTALLSTNAWGAQTQQLYTWGYPYSAKGWDLQYYGPTMVDGVPGTIVQISASNSTSYALTKGGEVWAWGVGQAGALGNGTASATTTTPVQVKFPTGVKITSLPSPMPFDTGMAIDSRGNVWGWGANLQNPLCVTTADLDVPVKLPLTHVTQATGAGVHALYVSDGKILACGGNAGGELGDGTTVASISPVAVVGLPHEPIRAVMSSWEDSGAVMADGSYYDWGFNHADQLGNGSTTNGDIPVRVVLPLKVRKLFLGGSAYENGQTVAILTNGSVWAWGSNQYGQLGNGKRSSSSGPTRVDLPPRTSFVQIMSGGSTMYAIERSGAVWAWGQNNVGQLGFGAMASSDVPAKTGITLSCVSSTAWNVEGLKIGAGSASP